jgi:Domain of unknown function (DUF4375)
MERAGQLYWSQIEPIWLPINEALDDPAAFLRAFRTVRREIGYLFAAHWCQSEIRNGGLSQFFGNSTGILAPEALRGFEEIGLADWAAVLREAMALFGPIYPRERSERQNALARMHCQTGNGKVDPFRELDNRFFSWLNTEPDRWEHAFDAYARAIRP